MARQLTIWIPTYRRPERLAELLRNLEHLGVTAIADVIVSDNDPASSLALDMAGEPALLPAGVIYRCNPANLSAGANFLRAFEICKTPWLMIVGDDDLFADSSVEILTSLIDGLSKSVVAVKFDSSLFGSQQQLCVSRLQSYVDRLTAPQYADAFNNLCLVSNWLFRCEPCRRHLSSAYLGYSSKISHLFPALRACALEGGQLIFSAAQPILHGSCEDSSWPKASTWFEMVITLTSFCGFIEKGDRAALLQMLFHADWRRNIAKCLRVHQFYGDRRLGVGPWQVHCQLALVCSGYRGALMLALPLLLVPVRFWPRWIVHQLGDPGSFERW